VAVAQLPIPVVVARLAIPAEVALAAFPAGAAQLAPLVAVAQSPSPVAVAQLAIPVGAAPLAHAVEVAQLASPVVVALAGFLPEDVQAAFRAEVTLVVADADDGLGLSIARIFTGKTSGNRPENRATPQRRVPRSCFAATSAPVTSPIYFTLTSFT
jgi:hypothetical protein